MEAGNDKLSTLQIMCSARSLPIPRLSTLREKLCQTSLKRASPAAFGSLITVVDEVLQERLIWWFLNNSNQFFLSKPFTGVDDTAER